LFAEKAAEKFSLPFFLCEIWKNLFHVKHFYRVTQLTFFQAQKKGIETSCGRLFQPSVSAALWAQKIGRARETPCGEATQTELAEERLIFWIEIHRDQ